MPRHIVKGDTVIVTWQCQGLVGEVIRVLPDEDRVVVSGVNVGTSVFHVRSRTLRVARSVPSANPYLNVVPVVDGKPSRVRFESRDDGKVRLAARDGSVLHELKKARDWDPPYE